MPASLFLEAKGRGEDLAVFAPSAAASSPWVFGLRFLFLIFVLISDLTFLPKFLQSRRTDVNLLVPSESLESLSVVSGFSELIILSTSALLVVLGFFPTQVESVLVKLPYLLDFDLLRLELDEDFHALRP